MFRELGPRNVFPVFEKVTEILLAIIFEDPLIFSHVPVEELYNAGTEDMQVQVPTFSPRRNFRSQEPRRCSDLMIIVDIDEIHLHYSLLKT